MNMVDEDWIQEIEEEDHIGCPAYPNCDIDSLGCHYASGEDVEWYGHRD